MAVSDTPAFPSVSPTEQEVVTRPGMTLRDWFAGQALAAGTIQRAHDNDMGRAATRQSVAETCYAVADAIMVARDG